MKETIHWEQFRRYFRKGGFIILAFMLMACFCAASHAQSRTISGNITDGSGNPLVGVTVVVKGSKTGTISNDKGHFSLSGVTPDDIVVFSYLGMATQELPVGNKRVIDVKMEESSVSSLGEVVVIGYGTQKKSDLTGSVASADLEAFREAPNTNIMQSLQGSVPGIHVGQVNTAGQEPSISIRGQTTLNGNESPLVVVDGIIFPGRIGDINPADIQSVDILKDPSSKAVYGSQAANGVILITTRKGKKSEKASIHYSGSYTVATPTVNARPLHRDEFLQKVRDIEYADAYLAPDYTQPNPDWDYSNSELLPSIRSGIESGTDYNWWKALTSPAYIQNHLLNITGGSNSTTYYISGGYTDQKGMIKNDRYKRASVRINIQSDVTSWLTVGGNTFAAFDNFSGNAPNMTTIVTTSPLVSPKDSSGKFIIDPLGNNTTNPFLSAAADDRNLVNTLSGNAFAIIKIPSLPGFSYRINYSNDLKWGFHGYSNPYSAGQTGEAYKNNSSQLNTTIDNILNYNKQFGDHYIDVTLVAGENKAKYENTSAEGTNIPDLTLSYNNLQQAIIPTITSGAWKESSVYQLARANYNYKSRYLLTATLRRDGFSGFAKNNKIALFPSLGVGWVMTKEPFFQVPVINFLKLRASYGQTGNQTSRYSSLSVVDRGDDSKYVFGDGGATAPGQTVSSLGNNDLSWELTSGLNIGLDFSVLNSRISGSVEYYKTNTKNLLWDMAVPQITGFSSVKTNLGEIANTGFEFSLRLNPVRTKHFNWNVNLNLSSNKNKIVQLLGTGDLVASGLFIGKSIGTIYDYQIDGIWQLNDDIPNGFFPGTYRIRDQNNDGVISAADDRKILGRSEPAYEFGIQNTFRYDRFSLRFFIHSIQGGKNGYLKVNYPSSVGNTSGNAQQANWLTFYYNDRWSPSTPNGKYPLPWVVSQIQPKKYFSRSFVRLQDISLSYQLDTKWARKLEVSAIKLYVSGKNLLTLTKWDGWDPETGQGIAGSSPYPVMKSYTFGLDVSF